MSESTKPAQCLAKDWGMARDCGLLGATPGTNAWDAALGRFADAIRAALARQPQGEAAPIGYINPDDLAKPITAVALHMAPNSMCGISMPVYAAPQTSAKALTDEQIIALADRGEYLTPSPSKYPELGHGTQYHCGAPGLLQFARALLAAEQPSEDKRELLTAASHALRSYQYGNAAPDLAEAIADRIDAAIAKGEGK